MTTFIVWPTAAHLEGAIKRWPNARYFTRTACGVCKQWPYGLSPTDHEDGYTSPFASKTITRLRAEMDVEARSGRAPWPPAPRTDRKREQELAVAAFGLASGSR